MKPHTNSILKIDTIIQSQNTKIMLKKLLKQEGAMESAKLLELISSLPCLLCDVKTSKYERMENVLSVPQFYFHH